MKNLPDIQIGERKFSELSPNEQDTLLLAANILVQWIIQEAEKRNETNQPVKLLGSGTT